MTPADDAERTMPTMTMPPPACQLHGFKGLLMQYAVGEFPNRVFFCPACNCYWQERQSEEGRLYVDRLHHQNM